MHNGTTARLLANLLAPSHRRPFASATGAIAFSEGFMATQAPEPSFVEHQLDPMAAQRHIAFDPGTHIVLLHAGDPTMGTRSSLIGSSHFDSKRSIGLHLLLEDTQSL
jgi:hypothetical protein